MKPATAIEELREAGLAGLRAIVTTNPALAPLAEDILAIARGAKVATEPKRDILEPVVTRKELCRLTGLTGKTLDYHCRKGRLTRVRFEGATRGAGYTRESVRRLFGCAVAEGGAR